MVGTADVGVRVWTAERVHQLGVVTDVPTASAIFQISRSVGYDLVRRGCFPVPLIRVGDRYRVPTAPILALLGLDRDGASPGPDENRNVSDEKRRVDLVGAVGCSPMVTTGKAGSAAGATDAGNLVRVGLQAVRLQGRQRASVGCALS
ncbi:hypothetical protein Afe04nite_38680 [Asanoa ferruginea]|nr:hypothetical protein Afe04nite_38680 [Asanoa ferruginea]